MMTPADWRDLALRSITNPADTAREMIDWHLPRETLWTALLLMAVLNTMVFAATNLMTPGADAMLGLLGVPAVYFVMVVMALVLLVYALTWTGRGFGGHARPEDIMVLVIWLQALRIAVQLVVLVLLFISPLLGGLLVFAAGVVGLYMLVHFIDAAHGLGSPWRAAGVLLAAIVGIALGLSMLLSLAGVQNLGGPSGV